jgi:hypothetical protein
MDNLDDYSRRFADVLFGEFPEWRQFASARKATDAEDEGFLVVTVPAPARGLIVNGLVEERGDHLRIDSAGEITVGFDYHHTHFDNFDDQTEAQNFANAARFIRSIVVEEICVAAVFADGSFCGSTTVAAGETPDLSGWAWLPQSCQEVYVRSWRGTHNRRYELAEVLGGNGGAS